MLTSLRRQTAGMLRRYLEQFPEEQEKFDLLRSQLESGEDCFVRSNMIGHITTSAAVLSVDRKRILLIDHRILNLWMPPGGHYDEGTETLWESAAREVREETGVSTLVQEGWCLDHLAPLDIDTHRVPANPAKGEGEHRHHDFRFLAVAPEESELVPQLAEVRDAKWVPIAALRGTPNRRLTTLADKLDRLRMV
jgi:8-oxo-dGTP pyrophosphatase MutT (NUDIX family)